MKASEALKLVTKYKHPKTLAGILAEIEYLARTSHVNCTFYFSRKKAKAFQKPLEKLGYKTAITQSIPMYDNNVYLEVMWDDTDS